MNNPSTRRLTASAALVALTALPALAEVPTVMTDIPATGSLVQQVLGDLGEVGVLLPAGGDAHHHQLRPSDAAALQDADLLIWVGPELTPWLDRAAGSLSNGRSLALLAQPETHRRSFDGEADGEHDHEDEAADVPEDHDAEGHDHGGLDPHAWLDPLNGKLWLTVIADALSEADPDNAAIYAANASDGAAELDQTIRQIGGLLAPVSDRRFVVLHDAYGYFTDSFGLDPAIAVSAGDASAPSAARLSQVRDELQAESVLCAFPENGHDPALIESIIEDTAIRMGDALDPSGARQRIGAPLYSALLQQMGETMADCLSGGE